MGVDMVPKESDSPESLQAQVAHVWPLIAVNFDVTIESREFGRSERAGVTLEDLGFACREKTHRMQL